MLWYLPVSAEYFAKASKKRRDFKICIMMNPTGLHYMYPDGKVVEQLTIVKMVIVTL